MEPPSSIDPLPYLFTTSHWVGFIVLLILLLLSALLSGAETAYFSLSPTDIEELEAKKRKSSNRALLLISSPDLLLSSIVLLNTLTNIAFVLLSAYLLSTLGMDLSSPSTFFAFAALAVIVLLFFSETFPKIAANRKKVSFACFSSLPLHVGVTIAKPLSKLMVAISTKITKAYKAEGKNEPLIEDLSDALATNTNRSDEDKRLIKGIVDLVVTDVTEVMHPRVDIYAANINMNFNELFEFVLDCGYSRIPVYEGSIDSIKGVLYIKDLLPHFDKADESFSWQQLIRPAYFVPESKRINDLLREFQQKRIHMAIVVDEYGGTSGIITLEDILEEIVGEISDETDQDEQPVVALKDGSYIFEGKTTLGDFFRIVGINDDAFESIDEDVETLAGLVLSLKGGFPKQGEMFEFESFMLRVLSVDSRRITKIKVIKKDGAEKK